VKILDSDHCIAILRGKLDLGGKAQADEELAVTSISVGELTHGAHRSSRPEENLTRLDILLAMFTILSFDETSARRFGMLKAELERAGIRLDDMDLQIASIALDNKAILVTHNQKHFGRIKELELEDWLLNTEN
jgi:tRNA(fMet)-specific endonuclease VapC